MRKLFAMLAVVLALGATGCVAVPSGIASSSKPLDPDGYTVLREVEGRAVGVYFFNVPLSEPYPAKTATKRAIAAGGGDAIVGVTMDVMNIPIPFLSIIITTVHGTAVQSN